MNVDKLSTFGDIANKKVRAYNRCVMWIRASSGGGLAAGTVYLKGIDEEGRQEVVAMLRDMQARGYSTVRREVVGSI